MPTTSLESGASPEDELFVICDTVVLKQIKVKKKGKKMVSHLFALFVFSCAGVSAHGTTIQKIAQVPNFKLVTMKHDIPHDYLFSAALLARNRRLPHAPWRCLQAWGDEPMPTVQSDPQGIAALDRRLASFGYHPHPSTTSRLLTLLSDRLVPYRASHR